MFTVCYKGVFINCYTDRAECRTVWSDGRIIQHKSLHAAKIWITKHRL